MKRFFFLLVMTITISAHSQKTDLATVNTVKPKKGQKMAFEAAYKVHIAKFHSAEEKLSVYEILTGPYAGYYHLVNSGRSFSDFDKERGDANAHNVDLDKTFFPYLEETINGTYRLIDSLSYTPYVSAEKFVVTVNHLKQGLDMNDYRRELARAIKINKTSKSPFFASLSTAFYEQLWDGSDQATVSIRSLKDGFKTLEQGFFPSAPEGSPGFRELYTKEYGSDAWDERVKFLEGVVVKTEQYIMKLRKDLSSQ
jgi:hypothetical protein